MLANALHVYKIIFLFKMELVKAFALMDTLVSLELASHALYLV
jgi:hypothetical protein